MKSRSTLPVISGMPRLSDAARQADVSIGTVSRVLSGKADVAAHLAERVLRAARTLGYERRGSLPAMVQSSAKSAMIGYLVDVPSLSQVTRDPFSQHFLAGIEDGVNSRDGRLCVGTTLMERLSCGPAFPL